MNIAIVTAAGKGSRLNQYVNKVFLGIGNKAIICRTIEAFERNNEIDKIILVTRREDINHLSFIVKDGNYSKVARIIEGGKERQDSVYNGIKAIEKPDDNDIVIIHNGANPFVSGSTINSCINAAREFGVSAAGIKSRDTVKAGSQDSFVEKTLERESIWLIQTPQAMKFGIAKKVFEKAMQDGFYGTDDVMLAERCGYKVKIIESNPENFKVTYPSDIFEAENMLKFSRVGLGVDSHRFCNASKDLVLAGVKFDGPALEANSDGDVVLHSLFNAISQAVGGMSIGFYSDTMCKAGITDSREYLKVAMEMVRNNGCCINNIGIMMECKTPKIDPKAEEMRASLEKITGVPKSKIGVTATTGEGLTDFGKGLGIQVFSIVSVSKDD